MLFRLLRKIKNKLVIRVKEVQLPYTIELQATNRYKNQVAVVTGGSGVIGRAIAFRLASEGAHVIVCGTNSERLFNVVNEIFI